MRNRTHSHPLSPILGDIRGPAREDSHAKIPRAPLDRARGQAAGAKNCGLALQELGGGKYGETNEKGFHPLFLRGNFLFYSQSKKCKPSKLLEISLKED